MGNPLTIKTQSMNQSAGFNAAHLTWKDQNSFFVDVKATVFHHHFEHLNSSALFESDKAYFEATKTLTWC